MREDLPALVPVVFDLLPRHSDQSLHLTKMRRHEHGSAGSPFGHAGPPTRRRQVERVGIENGWKALGHVEHRRQERSRLSPVTEPRTCAHSSRRGCGGVPSATAFPSLRLWRCSTTSRPGESCRTS